MAHAGALRACYESEAQRNPNLKGGISVAWQIDATASPAEWIEERVSAGPARLRSVLDAWRERGLLVEGPERVWLTEAGFLLSDALFIDLL